MAFVPLLQANRAELALADGALTAALHYAETACALGEKTRQRMSLGEAQRVLGKVYLNSGKWDQSEQAIRAGAVNFLSKPFSAAELINLLKSVTLESSRERRAS